MLEFALHFFKKNFFCQTYRGVSSGAQDLLEGESNPFGDPVGSAINKLEGQIQCSGEAK